jgi:hypothetical protein
MIMEENQNPEEELYTIIQDDKGYPKLIRTSYVKNPRFQSPVVFFSKDVLNFADDDKQYITGAELIPGMKLPKIHPETGKVIPLIFSKEQIEDINKDFFKGGNINETNIEHDQNGISKEDVIIESWIKSDLKNDKSIALGLPADLPVGTLFRTRYISDKEKFLKMKSGEIPVYGYSPELGFDKIIKLSKDNIEMENKDTKEKIKTKSFLSNVTQTIKDEFNKIFQEELSQIDFTEKEINNTMENTNKTAEDTTKVTAPDHTAELTKLTQMITDLTSTVTTLKTEVEASKTENKTLVEQFSAIKTENETLKADVEKFSKKPAIAGVNTTATAPAKDVSKMKFSEKLAYEILKTRENIEAAKK